MEGRLQAPKMAPTVLSAGKTRVNKRRKRKKKVTTRRKEKQERRELAGPASAKPDLMCARVCVCPSISHPIPTSPPSSIHPRISSSSINPALSHASYTPNKPNSIHMIYSIPASLNTSQPATATNVQPALTQPKPPTPDIIIPSSLRKPSPITIPPFTRTCS